MENNTDKKDINFLRAIIAVFCVIVVVNTLSVLSLTSSVDDLMSIVDRISYSQESGSGDGTSHDWDLAWNNESWVEVGSVDYENLTADVHLTVALTDFVGDPALTLVLDKTDHPLTETAVGTYEGDLTVSLVTPYDMANLCVTSAGRTVVMPEFDSWYYEACCQCLPIPEVSSSLSGNKLFGRFKYWGSYSIIAAGEYRDYHKLKKVTVSYETSDGRTIGGPYDVTREVDAESQKAIEQGLDMGDDLLFRIHMTTEEGWTTESLVPVVSSWEKESAWEEEDDWGRDVLGDLVRITDPDGKVVWERLEAEEQEPPAGTAYAADASSMDEPEELEGYEGLDEKETTERMIKKADQLPVVQDKV